MLHFWTDKIPIFKQLPSRLWAACEQLVSHLWATCEQLVSNLWATCEPLVSSLWATCEQLVSHLWATCEQLVRVRCEGHLWGSLVEVTLRPSNPYLLVSSKNKPRQMDIDISTLNPTQKDLLLEQICLLSVNIVEAHNAKHKKSKKERRTLVSTVLSTLSTTTRIHWVQAAPPWNMQEKKVDWW